ncbi:uncharacterized protein LOC143034758 [Oratosquilla oratoria]|uniref:uncharacterized protein LOC143034758 n=1 Tax=Oratosquilla oratoria TaxID=337810 RepID=UPI003F7777AF
MQWNCRAIDTAWDLLVQHLENNSYEIIALQSLLKRPHLLPALTGYHYPPFVGTDDSGMVRVATYVSKGLATKSGSLPGFSLDEGHDVVTSITVEEDWSRDGRWTRHIQQVCLNARRALNLVRVIRREPWGQRRETLIPIVRTLVRSRLLFGSPALHDLSPENTYKMVQIECQALRLGLDLPHSVPHEQVYNEAGVLPLRYRLKKDAGRYLFGSARVPNSTEDEMYEEWISAPPTAPIHGLPSSVRDLCLRAGLQPSDRRRVAQYQVDPFPPWTISPAEVELDNPHLLAARTRELLALKYQEEFLVYTDGSVLEDGRTGAGIFLEATRESFSVKLTPTTILTAELVAIKEALNEIIAFPDPPSRVTVLSDSRSSLVVIQRGHCPSSPEILNDILHLSDEAAKMGVRLRYQWVPSHVGLHGNEMADKAAKHGALAPKDSETPIHLTASDAIRRIDRAAWAQWETDYAATASARGWPTSYLGPNPPTLASLPSHISSTISRIRVDHWRTQYTGTYCACGTELASFRHCLLLCPALEDHFRQLRTLLGDPDSAHDRLRADSTPDVRYLAMVAKLVCSSPVGTLL